MHLNENDLRAYYDDQLPTPRRSEAEAHLSSCPECQAELAALSARAGQVESLLQTLGPSPVQTRGAFSRRIFTGSAAAWRTFEQRIQEKPSMSKIFARFRSAWATLLILAALVISLSFPSVQALASNFLRLFRVQQVTALPLDLTSLKDARFDPTVGEALSQVLARQIKVTRPSSEPFQVNTAAQASERAKFHVRTSPSQAISRITVQPGVAFEGTFDSALAQEVLQNFGKGNLQLPSGLDGAVLKANIPDAVMTAYGSCRYDSDPDQAGATGGPSLNLGDKCVMLMQMPSPTVDTPPDLPIQKLAEIGLQVMGQSPEQAARLAVQIDWTTTLVIPVPRGEVSTQTVSVDGVEGTLVRQLYPDTSLNPAYLLVWTKNGIVYGLMGSGSPERGLTLGNSLE